MTTRPTCPFFWLSCRLTELIPTDWLTPWTTCPFSLIYHSSSASSQTQGANEINALEWRFLISGITLSARKDLPNPDPSWIEANVWSDICLLPGLPAFSNFPTHFTDYFGAWKEVFDSIEPQNVTFPAPYNGLGEGTLQRMCILRCLRRDKMMEVGR